MDIREFKKKKAEIIAKHGAWISYDLDFDGRRYTMSPVESNNAGIFSGIFLKTILDATVDFTPTKKWRNLSVLDLGCFEGQMAIEFARQDAKRVVGIDCREQNVAKANFVKEALDLKNFEVFVDDVRNLSADKYGTFDVVLCLGLLYHLPPADTIKFTKQLFEIASYLAVIDTHISIRDEHQINQNGKTYHGLLYDENDNSTQSAKGSEPTFWPTKTSLFRLIRDAGFKTLYTIPYSGKAYRGALDDRLTVVAVKDSPSRKKISLPWFYEANEDEFFEKDPALVTYHYRNVGVRNVIKK